MMMTSGTFHTSELKSNSVGRKNPFDTIASELLQHILMFLTCSKNDLCDWEILYVDARKRLDSLFCCNSLYKNLQTLLLSKCRIHFSRYEKLASSGKLMAEPKRILITEGIKI